MLTERDPSFDLPQEKRYAASIYEKVLKHSPELRKGLAEGLAILGNKTEVLSSCSPHKAEHMAISDHSRNILKCGLDTVGQFERPIANIIGSRPRQISESCRGSLEVIPLVPFDELFAQEGPGSTGNNYLTGLLWALEGLAWEEEYLVRVCGILGDIASHDPGGNWANRPLNSLATILLPWLPQTLAPVEKCKVAVETVLKDHSQIGWELVINLLPGQNRTSLRFA